MLSGEDTRGGDGSDQTPPPPSPLVVSLEEDEEDSRSQLATLGEREAQRVGITDPQLAMLLTPWTRIFVTKRPFGVVCPSVPEGEDQLSRSHRQVIVEALLGRWYQRLVDQETRLKHGAQARPVIRWSGVLCHRLPDNDVEMRRVLVGTPMAEWIRLGLYFDAILLYTCLPATAAALRRYTVQPVYGQILYEAFPVGLVEVALLAKAHREPPMSFLHYIKRTVLAVSPASLRSEYRYVHVPPDLHESNDSRSACFIHLHIGDNVEACGPAEAEALAALESPAEAELKSGEAHDNRFYETVRALLHIEAEARKHCKGGGDPRSNPARAQELRAAYDAAVCRHYVSLMDFCSPATRVRDYRLRLLLHFHYFDQAARGAPETDLRALEEVVAGFLRAVLRACWPAESHVLHLLTFSCSASEVDAYRLPPDVVRRARDSPQQRNEAMTFLPLAVQEAPAQLHSVANGLLLGCEDSLAAADAAFAAADQAALAGGVDSPPLFDSGGVASVQEPTLVAAVAVSSRLRAGSAHNRIMFDSDSAFFRLVPGGSGPQPLETGMLVCDPFPTRLYCIGAARLAQFCETARRLLAPPAANLGRDPADYVALALERRRVRNALTGGEYDGFVASPTPVSPGSEAGGGGGGDEPIMLYVFPAVVFESRAAMQTQLTSRGLFDACHANFTLIAVSRDAPLGPLSVLQPSLEDIRATLDELAPLTPSPPPTATAATTTTSVFDDAAMVTAARAAIKVTTGAPPTVLWLAPESDFAATARDSAILHALPLLRGAHGIPVARVECASRVVPYVFVPDWLSERARSWMVDMRTRLLRDVHHNNLADFLRVEFHAGDSEALARTIPSLTAVFRTGHRSNANKARFHRAMDAAGSVVSLTASAETLPAAIPTSLAHANEPRRVTLAEQQASHVRAQQQAESAQVQYANQSYTKARAPGTPEERKKWDCVANANGEKFRDFITRKGDLSGRDPKRSIPIKQLPASDKYPNPSFLWSDYKNDQYGSAKARTLAYYVTLVEELGVPAPQVRALAPKAPPRPAPVEGQPHAPIQPHPLEKLLDEELQRRLDPRSAFAIAVEMERDFALAMEASTISDNLDDEHFPRQERALPRDLAQKLDSVRAHYVDSTSVDVVPEVMHYLCVTRGLGTLHPAVLRSPYLRAHSLLAYSISSAGMEDIGERGRKRHKAHFPALLCFCPPPEGDGSDVHVVQRIWVPGGDKLAIAARLEDGRNPAKKTDGVIRNENALWPAQAGAPVFCPFVYVAEGPETALSIAAVSPLLPVFAALGIGNFWRFRYHMNRDPQPTLVLVLDREPGAGVSRQEGLAAQMEQLRTAGWKSVVAWLPKCEGDTPHCCCKDANDVLRTHGLDALREQIGLSVAFCRVPLSGDDDERAAADPILALDLARRAWSSMPFARHSARLETTLLQNKTTRAPPARQ